jgi:hypothetical protein
MYTTPRRTIKDRRQGGKTGHAQKMTKPNPAPKLGVAATSPAAAALASGRATPPLLRSISPCLCSSQFGPQKRGSGSHIFENKVKRKFVGVSVSRTPGMQLSQDPEQQRGAEVSVDAAFSSFATHSESDITRGRRREGARNLRS